MTRKIRAEKALETLAILECGHYKVDDITVNIATEIKQSVNESRLFRSDEFDPVLEDVGLKLAALHYNTVISVRNVPVLEAAAEMTATEGTVGCLNFASAKNPGGGFLNGAVAQEESLSLSSSLYPTQLQHFGFYEHNRERKTLLYSDHMIFSPGVSVFRNDEGALLPQPYQLSIVTSPAVNVGALMQNELESLDEVAVTMFVRMDKLLALFVHYGIRRILLGAWGCGVFQNDPAAIAVLFARFLQGDGKYAHCFEEVVFAVYDHSKKQDKIQQFTQKFAHT